MSAAGFVYLVGAGPGDPGLLTARAIEVLGRADVVLHDKLIPLEALRYARPGAEILDVGKIGGGPQVPQAETERLLVERCVAGKVVVRLKGGDPYVFGRGGEEVLACAAAGVPVLVVPGVTSAVAAPAGAGIPVTHRGVAHEFTVVSGHLPPDHPASLVDWAALARLRGTLVVLMGLRNLPAITATLVAHGRAPGTPVAVVQEGTTGGQRTLRSTLGEVVDQVTAAGLRPPATVVVGAVAVVLDQGAGRDPAG